MICSVSIKKSLKRGLWQMKEVKDHNVTAFGRAHDVLEKCMFLSQINVSDRNAIYNFIFSDEPFEGYQMKLERKDDFFHIVDVEEFAGKAQFPNEIFKYLKYPEYLYIKIERAPAGIRDIEIIQ